MYKTCIFFVGIYLTTFTNALFDEASSIKKITNSIELSNEFMDVEFLTAVLFYRNDNRSRAIEPIFNQFADKGKNHYRFVAVNCDSIQKDANKEAIPACQENFKEALPQILFLEPQIDRSNVQSNRTLEPNQHRFDGKPDLEDLNDFALKLMPNYSKRLVNLEQLEKFLAEQPVLKRALFLTNKKSVPQYWKALSSHFKDRLVLGEALSKGYLIHQKYNIEKFPAVIVIIKKTDGTTKETTYEGELDFEKLEAFLSKYASVKKIAPIKNRDRPAVSQPKDPQEGLSPPKDSPKPIIKDFVPERFEETVYGTEGLVMIHVFKGNDTHAAHDDVVTKFNSIVDIYNLNCTDARALKFAEEKLKIVYFPGYRLYPIGNKAAKAKSKVIYTKIKIFTDIAKDISMVIGDKSISIEDEEHLESELESVVLEAKPTLVLFHNQEEISMSFRVLAQLERYKTWINFANYKNPSAEVKKKFNLEQLPKLVMVFAKDPSLKDLKNKDNLQTAAYTGKYVFSELKEFLDTFLPTEIRTLTLSQIIPQVDKPEDFNLVCQNKNLHCAIGLIDGYSANDDAKTRVKNELAVLEKVKRTYSQKPLTFLWIDAACHSELLEALDITAELPSIVHYVPLPKVLIQYDGSFDTENITSFLEESLEGGTRFIKHLPEIPKLETKHCPTFHSERDPKILKKLSPKLPTPPRSEEKSVKKNQSKKKPSTKDEL